jgi:hypothetical protein
MGERKATKEGVVCESLKQMNTCNSIQESVGESVSVMVILVIDAP